MNARHLLIASAIFPLALACGRDRGTEARSAQNETPRSSRTSQPQAQVSPTPAQPGSPGSEVREERARIEGEAERRSADLDDFFDRRSDRGARTGGADATGEGREGAQAGNVQASGERQSIERKARERLQKLDARVNELTVKANDANAKTRADVNEDWQKYSRARQSVVEQLNRMDTVGEGAFAQYRDQLEARLDELERIADRIDRRL
jgi:hypothetical protein